MPKKFQLNANTKPEICDARRCGRGATHYMQGGVKLCDRHHKMLEEGELQEIYAGNAERTLDEPEDSHAAIQKFVEPIEKEAIEMVEQFENLQIADQDMADMAGELLQEIHEKLKRVEIQEKTVTQPLHQAKKAVHDLFRPAKSALNTWKTTLKTKLSEYISKQESERMAALASGNTEEALAIPTATVPKGMTESKRWTYEVTDIDKVPRGYLTVNDTAVKASIKSSDPESLEIPGIRIYQESGLRMGRS